MSSANETNQENSRSAGLTTDDPLSSMEISPGNKGARPVDVSALRHQELSYRSESGRLTDAEKEERKSLEREWAVMRRVKQFYEVLRKHPQHNDQDTSNPISKFEGTTEGM
ncbi:hypothetical protein I302_100285 [Kwoniella bestiolae CBS 10118]|uniref:Uncharacterized protein n=1 Tax=Kwoniella bestiolae CBS 10118 TaxID=1296100 RepID=A0A1B9G4Q9_9TREE|nr:hypothetical protein I302_03657 [Kwoniella bestiolae CBS 10118]OCF25980.1 hypothetical protein I302_03657 [Kwoniella bestiolae CBS 10118]